MVGILSYGAYIPKRRIKVDDIANHWQNITPAALTGRLRLSERAVLGPDEDTITLAVAASKDALARASLGGSEVQALYLGTCTNPYDSRPSCTLAAEALGLPFDLMCADIQFSGKSGTAAIQVCSALVEAKMIAKGIAIGADTINRHVPPGDMYEATASAGAVAFIMGNQDLIVEIEGQHSVASDLTDFFRLEGERYIKCGMGLGGTTWQVGLIDHSAKACQALMHKLGHKPGDYTHAVFQQPYGVTPFQVARTTGFTEEQVAPGVVATAIGDCGAASALLGLAQVLDNAQGGEHIMLVSYGFGAGSDAFSLKVLPSICRRREEAATVRELLADKMLVDYATATRCEYKYMKTAFPLGTYY